MGTWVVLTWCHTCQIAMVTDPQMVAEVLRQPELFDKAPQLGRPLTEVQSLCRCPSFPFCHLSLASNIQVCLEVREIILYFCGSIEDGQFILLEYSF